MGATLIWGTSFPLLKDSVGVLSPSIILSGRFIIAALVLLPTSRRFTRSMVRDGVLLGAVTFAAYLAQAIGLETTTSNRAAFITALNVILVPLLGVGLGRRVAFPIVAAGLLALMGIGVMFWEGGALTIGDLWEFGCAMGYAVSVLMMEAFAPRHDPLPFTALQVMVMAVLATGWAAPSYPTEWPLLLEQVGAIAYLGVMTTALTTWAQTCAQRYVPATEAAIIYTLEPVSAAAFAYWWLGERMGWRGLLGATMVIGAMLLSQARFDGWRRQRQQPPLPSLDPQPIPVSSDGPPPTDPPPLEGDRHP